MYRLTCSPLETFHQNSVIKSFMRRARYEQRASRRRLSGARNRLIHGYMSVNLDIVWDTVQKVVPGFVTTVASIQQELD